MLNYRRIRKKEYVFIVLQNTKSNFFKVTGYSAYFYNKEIVNKKLNHSKVIVCFLNYVFIENKRKYKISSISDITKEMGEDFLNSYKEGKVGRKRGRNGKKTRQVIEEYQRIFGKFYTFLLNEYKMNFLSYKDLDKTEDKKGRIRNIYRFSIFLPTEKRINKVKRISFEL